MKQLWLARAPTMQLITAVQLQIDWRALKGLATSVQLKSWCGLFRGSTGPPEGRKREGKQSNTNAVRPGLQEAHG